MVDSQDALQLLQVQHQEEPDWRHHRRRVVKDNPHSASRDGSCHPWRSGGGRKKANWIVTFSAPHMAPLPSSSDVCCNYVPRFIDWLTEKPQFESVCSYTKYFRIQANGISWLSLTLVSRQNLLLFPFVLRLLNLLLRSPDSDLRGLRGLASLLSTLFPLYKLGGGASLSLKYAGVGLGHGTCTISARNRS